MPLLPARFRPSLLSAMLGGLMAVANLPPAILADEPQLSSLQLPRLYKVPLSHPGVDIRHVLYHKQGFQRPGNGAIQLEIVDLRANHHDGSLWFWGGAAARCLVRYVVTSGKIELHPLPRSPRPDQELPDHLYLLAKYPYVYLIDLRDPGNQLAAYHVEQRTLSFAPLLADQPQRRLGIVTGNVPAQGSNLYLFVGADAEDTMDQPKGLIRWNCDTAQGELIPYPYAGPGPIFGVESPDGQELWCPIWNGNALARFNLRSARWDGFWPTPFEPQTQPTSAGIWGDRFYCVDLFRPRLLPFDTKTQQWLPPVSVPGHGTEFGVLGGGFVYQGKVFCSLATLKSYLPPGGPIGVDGKPWHFLNRRLCFDPRTKACGHWILPGSAHEYWMNSVAVQHGPHIYFVAIELAQPDGTVNQFGRGMVAIFQTHPRGMPGSR